MTFLRHPTTVLTAAAALAWVAVAALVYILLSGAA
jgi:hypothetical protein